MNAGETGAASDAANQAASEKLAMQFQYAWNWFECHAKQRISMFNYFLLAMGILATAYVHALKEAPSIVAFCLALMGLLVSAIFWLLDWRNKQLVHMGEDLLRELEHKRLFPGFRSGSDWEVQHALLHEEDVDERAARAGGRRSRGKRLQVKFLKHGFLIRGLEALVLVFFVVAVWLSLVRPIALAAQPEVRSGSAAANLTSTGTAGDSEKQGAPSGVPGTEGRAEVGGRRSGVAGLLEWALPWLVPAIPVSILALVACKAYRKARDELLSPLRTELFKERLCVLKELSTMVSGRTEGELARALGVWDLLLLNCMWLVNLAFRSFNPGQGDGTCELPVSHEDVSELWHRKEAQHDPRLNAAAGSAIFGGDPAELFRWAGAQDDPPQFWSAWKCPVLVVPKKMGDAQLHLQRLAASPLMPAECAKLVRGLQDVLAREDMLFLVEKEGGSLQTGCELNGSW